MQPVAHLFSSQSVTVPPRYLDGLLAAVRPGLQEVAAPPSSALPPMTAESAESPADSSESGSREEQIKRRLHPLDSYPQLWECAAANRPPDADDQFRFQWFGLFYQAPAQDAFTLRLRLPGGRLKPFQLAGLANITQQHASGEVVLNSQGGLDLPGVPVTSATEILREIESIGLRAQQTGGDCVQSIRGGECDGLFADHRHAPIYPLACALEQALAYSPTCSDLPRPCEIHFRMVGEALVVRQDIPVDSIILQASDQLLAPGNGPGSSPASPFVMLAPDDPEGGFLLPYSQVVTSCLELLKGWSATADRMTRDTASLAAFGRRLGPDGTSALLGGAKRVPLPPRSGLKITSFDREPPSGCAVPGGRLLSGQLTALDYCCRQEGLQEVRLLRGHLFTAEATSDDRDASAALGRAMSL